MTRKKKKQFSKNELRLLSHIRNDQRKSAKNARRRAKLFAQPDAKRRAERAGERYYLPDLCGTAEWFTARGDLMQAVMLILKRDGRIAEK